jgi:hypothetical protein
MANLTAQPPPQLSSDGHWRWDGHQWEPVQPGQRGFVPAQLSSDGQWWWNGKRWVPAKAALRPHQTGLAAWALGLGLIPFAAAFAVALGTQPGVSGWSKLTSASIFITLVVCAAPGLTVGILVLTRTAPGPYQRRSWNMAGIGILLTLLGSIALFALMQTINSWIGP